MDEALTCPTCGYDLRRQPAEGVCPECAAPVAEAARVAALPAAPAWRESDPAWRRRVLTGLWVIVLLPSPHLAAMLAGPRQSWGSAAVGRAWSRCYVESYVHMVYPLLGATVGFALLFARERGTRPRLIPGRGARAPRTAWLRRVAVAAVTIMLAAGVGAIMGVTLLVAVGIDRQLNFPGNPGFRRFALWYANVLGEPLHWLAQAAASAAAVLAFAVLFITLRRANARLLAPATLAVGTLLALTQAAADALRAVWPTRRLDHWRPLFGSYQGFFEPEAVAWFVTGGTTGFGDARFTVVWWAAGGLEAAKWGLFLLIAARLTTARTAAPGSNGL